MRCFIAIDLPDEVKNELLKIQSELPEANLNLAKKENLHLTIKFLGEIDEKLAEKVMYILKKSKFIKFKAKLNGIGVFLPSFIRVVWTGAEPKEKFRAIHDEIDRKLRDIGFNPDKTWETHITLARVKFVKDKKGFIEKLDKIKIKNVEFAVDKIKLKKSVLTKQGYVYEDILSQEFL